MPSMPEASGESQSVPFEGQVIYRIKSLWLLWLFLFTYFGVLAYYLLQEDEVKLPLWHSSIRLLQNTARLLGQAALAMEKEYNDYVTVLH